MACYEDSFIVLLLKVLAFALSRYWKIFSMFAPHECMSQQITMTPWMRHIPEDRNLHCPRWQPQHHAYGPRFSGPWNRDHRLHLWGRRQLLCLKRSYRRERLRGSRDSSVGIVTRCMLDGRGLIPSKDKTSFSSSRCSRLGLRSTQPLSQWVPGFFRGGVRRPGSKTDNSHPSSVKFKNGALPPLHNTCCWCLVKQTQRLNCFYIPQALHKVTSHWPQGFEAFTAVVTKAYIYWDVTPCMHWQSTDVLE